MQLTDNHDFPLIEDGDEDWGDDVREWKENLDVLIELVGDLDDRPADPPTDTRFWATDEHVHYQYDGDEWHRLGTDWNGYELVFDDEEPDSDRYIRFEHED